MTSDSLLEGHLHRGCGGRYASASENVVVRVSGMAAEVERLFFRCDRCGDERRTVEQRERAEQAAVSAMRTTHGLLSPRDIKQLRERLHLSAEQLGELLYGIPRSIVQGWERGRYLQNREVDAMIRSLEDTDVLEERATRAGVTLVAAGEGVPANIAESVSDDEHQGETVDVSG